MCNITGKINYGSINITQLQAIWTTAGISEKRKQIFHSFERGYDCLKMQYLFLIKSMFLDITISLLYL